jgi:nucleoside-diphosphate-sugar epimerase
MARSKKDASPIRNSGWPAGRGDRGHGFLGWHLVQVLRQMRARLRTLALHPSLRHPILDLDDIEPVFGDVTDSKLVESVLSDAEIIFMLPGL